MIVDVCQRWRDRRDSYRPAREPFNPRAHEVAPIADHVAEAFVLQHHYSGRPSAGKWYFGLFEPGGKLVGAVVCGDGMPGARRILPCGKREGTEILRLVLLQHVAANAESWLVARVFEQLRRDGIAGVVSFSDPVPRTSIDGRTIFAGHCGTVYQALSAVYTGRATPRSQRLFADGTVFSPRTMQKIRAGESGWRYGVEQLVAAGATPPVAGEDMRAWLRRELRRVTRPLRHRGNFRYAWGLNQTTHRALGKHLQKIKVPVLPYPKLIPAPPVVGAVSQFTVA
jgi:hypothetical protein